MTFQHNPIAPTGYVPSSAGSIFSNPASQKTFLRSIILFNGNTTTEIVQVYNVPNSGGSVGTAGGGNQILEFTLAAKETLEFEIAGPGIIMADHNDSIQAATTTANKVTATLIGDEEA